MSFDHAGTGKERKPYVGPDARPTRRRFAMMVEDLRKLREQFLSIKVEAQNLLLQDLSDAQFNWQPGPNQWSIGQCLDHLLVTGRNSISNIHEAIAANATKRSSQEKPFRYGPIEKWFVRLMGPRVIVKIKAPRAYRPSTERLSTEIIDGFFRLQEE